MKAAQECLPSERRRSPRKGHIIEGWVSPCDSQNRTEVTTFDISRDGVSFDAQFSAPIGSHYIYEIGFGEKTLICDIQIVSCRCIANGIWHIGAEFGLRAGRV